MAANRVSQLPVELLASGNPKLRASQLPVELLASGNPKLRASQIVVEVLASITPPAPTFTWDCTGRTDVIWTLAPQSFTWVCTGATRVTFGSRIAGFWDCRGKTEVDFGAGKFISFSSGFRCEGHTDVSFGARITLGPGSWVCRGHTDVSWMGHTDGTPQGCLTGDGVYDGIDAGETNYVF